MSPFMGDIHGFYPDRWLLDDRNIAMTNGEDYCLFEFSSPNVYYGHYFCTSKGKTARDFSVECLDYMFDVIKAEIIQGLTPEDKRAARWMARQLGMKSYGITETFNGPHELFILTKNDWETKE